VAYRGDEKEGCGVTDIDHPVDFLEGRTGLNATKLALLWIE
jgi:hypothetical protein